MIVCEKSITVLAPTTLEISRRVLVKGAVEANQITVSIFFRKSIANATNRL